MAPDFALPPIVGALHPGITVIDIVPKPATTPLLAEAQARGCPTANAQAMISGQADAVLAFFGIAPRVSMGGRAMESERGVALVTGAARGIGYGIAAALAAHGFDVALASLEDKGPDLAPLEAHGGRMRYYQFDLADLDRHTALLERIEQDLGAPTCLVNNAGVSSLVRGDLLAVTPESFDRCVAVNLRGTFFLTQEVAKRMLAAGPSARPRTIVTISSANVEIVGENRGDYCMTKSALAMMNKLFASRLAAAGIAAFEVRPGLVLTRHDGAGGRALRRVHRRGRRADAALGATQRYRRRGRDAGLRRPALHHRLPYRCRRRDAAVPGVGASRRSFPHRHPGEGLSGNSFPLAAGETRVSPRAGIHRADAAAVAAWTPVFTGVTSVVDAVGRNDGASGAARPLTETTRIAVTTTIRAIPAGNAGSTSRRASEPSGHDLPHRRRRRAGHSSTTKERSVS